MAFSATHLREIESILTLWLVKVRPNEDIRDQVDIGYTIDKQDIYLEEIRPIWDRPKEIMRNAFAKLKYQKSTNTWNIYWKRGNLKWYSYDPNPKAASLEAALDIVDADNYGCFGG
jgi:hypothetical protein